LRYYNHKTKCDILFPLTYVLHAPAVHLLLRFFFFFVQVILSFPLVLVEKESAGGGRSRELTKGVDSRNQRNPKTSPPHSLEKPRNPKTSPPQQQLLGLLELGNPSARKKGRNVGGERNLVY
jgi:hypothetical protein